MKAEVLRKSILQMAIQGKLVPQDSSDEPASVLLQKIRAEKEKLIKQGKIKKEKPLSPITEAEKPFDIPNSWQWVRLGEIASIFGGKRIPAGRKLTTENTGYKYIRVSDMKDGTVSLDSLLYVPTDIYPSIARYIICKEDVYITVAGTIGRVGKIPWELDCANLTENADRIVFYLIDQNWLIKCLESQIVQGQIVNATTKVGQPKLAINKIQEFVIPLPPFNEQKRIVDAIGKFEPLIAEYEKLEQQAEKLDGEISDKLKKSILQYAIQGKLVPQDSSDEPASVLLEKIKAEKATLIKQDKIKKEKPLPPITDAEKPFDIPDTWQWVRLGDVSILNPKNNISDNMEVSFIPMCLVKDGYSNHHDFERKKWSEIKNGFTHFANGDIGVAKITPCFQNRKSVIFKNLINGYGAGTTELSVVRTVNNKIDASFLLMLFKSDYFIINGVKSFTGTAGQQRIHKDYIKNFLIPLPPLNEQKRIVARIEELFAEIDKIKQL